MTAAGWRFACPRCRAPLPDSGCRPQVCAECGAAYAHGGGMYRFLPPERMAEIEPFLAQYRQVRGAEGYRTEDGAYYRSLPRVGRGHPQAAVWRVRRCTFENLRRHVLTYFNGRALNILDLGAGNGWLAHRLAALGHRCAALDWLDDVADGLGARVHYPARFTCVQADFDRPPFAPGQFDLIIFNASLHYSPEPAATLRRAARLLAEGGALAIMDSPAFPGDEAGRRMLAGVGEKLEAEYGLGEVIRPGRGYLTEAGVVEAGRQIGLEFRYVPSRGNLIDELRRRAAGVRLGRAPASFGLWIGARRRPRC